MYPVNPVMSILLIYPDKTETCRKKDTQNREFDKDPPVSSDVVAGCLYLFIFFSH
jgi:hypothetical protein